MFIVDTDVLSATRRADKAPRVAAWLASVPDQDLFISVITIGEIERGIARQQSVDPVFAGDLRRWLDATMTFFADRIVDFGAEDARIWGRLSVSIGHHGADLMIAASALSRNATVATGNTAHFAPTGARTINPFNVAA
ncbi:MULTISPECIES: type II toxin-antitoxin system VapC family toxin [unclassified Roseitalea]|uniref:type II toxin-antitoxin system VapC family toxin n=1 Tax=unclassified Roseitalea TaxID=2639107 RepID=UPI00273E891C|nr:MULTISPECIES: type II toxin-antitoxin system VapC family toxin [unclassified Roseitalea]